MLYPLLFHPLFKERVWGGRKLEELFQKPLPPGPIGESWEISDRPGDVSVIANGEYVGKDLHWLLEHHGIELMGYSWNKGARFPLLIKILDAQAKLSLQVHPPDSLAAALGGEPKTEMWHIAAANDGAELFAGLKKGITAEIFQRELEKGTVAQCFHRIPVRSGDSMFLPSGRVHAIGAGLVIFEIQQNSDTTYRVFDWNRVGLDGKPRALHIKESLQSIDFTDFEPALINSTGKSDGSLTSENLAADPLFSVDRFLFEKDFSFFVSNSGSGCQIIGVLQGEIFCEGAGEKLALKAGQFCLLPASIQNCRLTGKNRRWLFANPSWEIVKGFGPLR